MNSFFKLSFPGGIAKIKLFSYYISSTSIKFTLSRANESLNLRKSVEHSVNGNIHIFCKCRTMRLGLLSRG